MMRRVLVVTWALGTACGVLLGLFGVQLVSSRFSTSRVSPLSHPEVLRALQAARNASDAREVEVALPVAAPDTQAPQSPPTDVTPARPSAGATPSPAPTSPGSLLPRPGATAGTLADPKAGSAGVQPTTTTVAPPPPPEPTTTTATTGKTAATTKKSDKNSERASTTSSSTTTTTAKKTTTTTAPPPASSDAQTKTISSKGGIVTVRWADGKVQIRQARPNPGWSVSVYNNGPDTVLVKFTRQGQASWVWAGYRNGTPASAVMECSTPSSNDCKTL